MKNVLYCALACVGLLLLAAVDAYRSESAEQVRRSYERREPAALPPALEPYSGRWCYFPQPGWVRIQPGWIYLVGPGNQVVQFLPDQPIPAPPPVPPSWTARPGRGSTYPR